MIVAMAVMRMMQPPIHEVIDVIAMGYAFVSAARSMRVRAPGVAGAARGIGIADLDDMFVDMVPMHVVQVAIMEVVHMTVVAHSRVSTVRAMLMRVIRVMLLVAGRHGLLVCLVPGIIQTQRIRASFNGLFYARHRDGTIYGKLPANGQEFLVGYPNLCKPGQC
jgi:hypothetical protein